MRSSPSRAVLRGNTPSSSPSRHTTRWGTERIGTSVQMVRWPVRKLATVGRPCSRSASKDRMSARRQRRITAGAVDRRFAHDVVEDALQLGALPASRSAVAVSASAAAAIDSTQPSTGLGRRRSSSADVEAVDQLGEAAGQIDGAAVDVVEGQHAAEQLLALLGHGHAEQHPVQAGPPGVGLDAGRA